MINYETVDSNDLGHNTMINYGTVDSNDLGHNSMIHYGTVDSNLDSMDRYQAPSQSHSPSWSRSSTKDMKMMDSSYVMSILGPESQWVERSDRGGERSGYYSYLTGEGDTVLVRYSA